MKKLVLLFVFMFAVASFVSAAPKPWTKDEEKKISLFFSNFAEVFLDDFAENELSDSLMLNFAQGHIYKNRYNKLETSKGEIENFKLIPATMVDEITLKFFGKKINHALKCFFVFYGSCDITKNYSFFWEIVNCTNFTFYQFCFVFCFHAYHSFSYFHI